MVQEGGMRLTNDHELSEVTSGGKVVVTALQSRFVLAGSRSAVSLCCRSLVFRNRYCTRNSIVYILCGTILSNSTQGFCERTSVVYLLHGIVLREVHKT